MAKLQVNKGTTSKILSIFIQDSSSTTGDGLTGLAWNTASLSWYYYREGAGTGATQVTLATMTIGTWASGGFVEIDATDMPGWYEIGIPDAAIASGADSVGSQLKGATNMAQLNLEIQLNLVDLVWDEILTGATHNVTNSAGKRLRQIQEDQGYALGRVWIDTINGSAGTTPFDNGTVGNPVDNIADALTIAADAAVMLSDFHVINGSTFTLSGSVANKSFFGNNWTVALNSKSIVSAYIQGASVTGIGTGSNYKFQDCSIGSVTLDDGVLIMCRMGGTFTLGAAGSYVLIDCVAELVGVSAPVLDYAAPGNSTVNYRRYSGGLTVNNLASGDILGIEIVSGGPVTLNGADATVKVAGMINTVTNNLTGSPNVIAGSLINDVEINAECDQAISDAFTFGVANKVDANVTHVNEIEVSGDGSLGNEWGPV